MKYIIALNKQLNKDDPNESDFFTESEMAEILLMVQELKEKPEGSYDIEVINDEIKFLEEVKKYDYKQLKVLNLTRRGSFNNKKVLVNSFCDLEGIPCVSSSAFSVNLSRNKKLMSRISRHPEEFPSSYEMKDLETLINSKVKVIIKSVQGAGSLGMDTRSYGYIEKRGNDYFLNDNLIDASVLQSSALQEFAEGTEVEVPFILENGELVILGVYEICKGEEEILTQELSDSFEYDVIENKDFNLDRISEIVFHVKEDFGIEYYGRVDLKINDKYDPKSYKVFDIATTPYFIGNTSLQKAFKKSKYSKIYVNILELLLNLE